MIGWVYPAALSRIKEGVHQIIDKFHANTSTKTNLSRIMSYRDGPGNLDHPRVGILISCTLLNSLNDRQS